MKIVLRSKILLVTKNEWTELSQDIFTVKDEEDKNLITCTVIEWTDSFHKWEIIITWKYSLNKLIYKWEEYFFLEEEDVVWSIENDV